MEKIFGKVLIFTDLHLGLKNGSKSRLAICIKVLKEIIEYIKTNNIKTCIFCGDWHHIRTSTDTNVMNVSYKLMQALSTYCNVYCIVGNHDSYLKNSIDINSLVMFNNLPNVKLIDKPTEISINNNKSLLVPWLGDISSYNKETFDIIFGHFDISQKFLIQSYIEEHKNTLETSSMISKQLEDSDLLSNNLFSRLSNIGDLVGAFIDIVKPDGLIFSGHIHGRKEFIAKGRKVIIIGDPYQQNLGEKEYSCGFYILNDDSITYKFIPITSVPRHIELRMSEIVNNFETYDFSIVKGNIIHKIYDVDVDINLETKINQKINDRGPYEELIPDYEVGMINSIDDNINLQNDSIKMINKSKLEYIKSYINNIDKSVLDEQKLDANKLYSILEEYYKLTIEEK